MGHIFAAVSPSELRPEQRRALEEEYPGLKLPPQGRLPSRRDIEAMLEAKPRWRTEYRSGTDWWTAFVTDDESGSASLRVMGYSGDPGKGHSFHFDTGDPEMVLAITAAIAARCGPFVVMDESGTMTVLVWPDGSRQVLKVE